MKNRTVLGILCLILALLLAFGLTPIMNKLSDGRVSVVRMKQDVSQGHKMTEDDIEIVSVGAVNLPSGVIKDKEAVLGKYASSDLWKGDCLFPAKLSDTADSAADVFRSLDGTQVAVSVTIPTFAGGLSGKLLNGDIVSLIVYSSDKKESFAPDALKYVRVITSTTSGGLDRDELTQKEDGTYDLPSTTAGRRDRTERQPSLTSPSVPIPSWRPSPVITVTPVPGRSRRLPLRRRSRST